MERVKRIAGDYAGWLLVGAAILAMTATVPGMMREAAGFAAWSLVEMAPVIGLAVLEIGRAHV